MASRFFRRRQVKPRDRGPHETHLRILAVIRTIPRGRVLSYGEVARRAGLRGRARLVGFILRTSPLADGVPWHRVVNASGRIAARSIADMRRQRELLLREGVHVGPSGRLNLGRYLWRVEQK